MNKRGRFSLTIVGALFLLALAASQSFAAPESRYFPETGHTVSGAFLDFYNTYGEDNGPLLFGYPITEAFQRGGFQLQYFQRALLQRAIGDTAYPTVVTLGRYFYEHKPPHIDRQPLPPAFWNATGCRDIVGVDGRPHPVCYDFLRFYEQYGDFLGNVVSDPLLENGIPVQYFINGRLEYHTNTGRIVLSNLGEWYFQQNEPNPQLRQPIQGSNAPLRQREMLRLEVQAAVQKVLTRPGEEQTIFIRVTDQLGQPVPYAVLTLTFSDGLGHPLDASLPPMTLRADAEGEAAPSIVVPSRPGHIAVDITAQAEGLRGMTETIFRVWR